MKTLINLLSILPVYQLEGEIDHQTVTGLTVDSREVKEGDLFVCIPGYTVDGHAFVNQAKENGAIAIVAEKTVDVVGIPIIYVRDTNRVLPILANQFYDHPTKKLHVTGVTGTNGKTSVTHLLDEIYRLDERKTASIGTIQMKIGNEVYPVANTTPEASFLQKNFQAMVQQKVEHVVMEVSSHALDLGRVNGCDFDTAIFTNLSQDHLDFHKDMDSYMRAKTRLFFQLGNSYDAKHPKYAVINQDDAYSDAFIRATSQPVVTYGIDHEANVQASDIILAATGTSFRLTTWMGEVFIHTNLMGKFNVYNMLAATTAALLSGVPLKTIKQSFEHSKGVRGRFEAVDSDLGFGVVIDYSHTPDSLDNVLKTLKSFVKGRIYLVVGCGGDRDKKKRPIMAEIADQQADFTFYTSDNPRSEDPMQIIEDMLVGVKSKQYEVCLDRKEAIENAIARAEADDVVLIAGKGHENYQIIGDQVLDFDDYQIALAAIKRND